MFFDLFEIFIGTITTGTATLTSTILRINITDTDGYDDSSSSDDGHGTSKHTKHHKPAKGQHSHSKDHGEKLKFLEINMMGATIELETIKEGFKAIKDRQGNVTDTDHRFVYIIKGYGEGVGIDLIFNKVKELSEFNEWRECLEAAKSTQSQQMSRLAQAKRDVISSAGQQFDLQTRFSDKMMPEHLVLQSRNRTSSFGSSTNLRRQHTVAATPPSIRKVNKSIPPPPPPHFANPPPIPGKPKEAKPTPPPVPRHQNPTNFKGNVLSTDIICISNQ